MAPAVICGAPALIGKRAAPAAEGNANMLKKLATFSIALSFVAALATTTATDAEARRGRGVGAAIVGTVIGLGILGAAAAAERDRGYYRSSCYPGPRECRVVGQKCWRDGWGYRQCRDDVRCWRPEICD
jgi:hypothetical protein